MSWTPANFGHPTCLCLVISRQKLAASEIAGNKYGCKPQINRRHLSFIDQRESEFSGKITAFNKGYIFFRLYSEVDPRSLVIFHYGKLVFHCGKLALPCQS